MSIRGLACAASMACALDLSAAPSSASTQIMVAQCLQFSACYLDTTPWGDTLSQSQLELFGLGTTVDLVVTQTSQLVIQLGKTTAVFSTSGAEVIETIDQFTGPGFYPIRVRSQAACLLERSLFRPMRLVLRSPARSATVSTRPLRARTSVSAAGCAALRRRSHRPGPCCSLASSAWASWDAGASAPPWPPDRARSGDEPNWAEGGRLPFVLFSGPVASSVDDFPPRRLPPPARGGL